MKKLLILILVITVNAFALEVDEKLTLRVLKISSSGKTVLINRGIEDGLVQGDHAKFFLSIGVVARGVLVKASPTRSVWSLYRLVNADPIKEDSVMRLKITPPVKITEDETKMIAVDDAPSATIGTDPRTLGIPLEEGAEDLKTSDADLAFVAAELRPESYANLVGKQYEIWASIGFEMSNTDATPDVTSINSQSGSSTWSNITLGGEYYFKQTKGFISKLSLAPFVRLSSNNTFGMSSTSGTQTKDQTTQFGIGANFYPFAAHNLVSKFIPFINFSFAFSSSSITVDNGTIIQDASGNGNALSIGAGVKMYTPKGYGMRAVLELFRESEKLTDSSQVVWVRNNTGPRLYAAISKRF